LVCQTLQILLCNKKLGNKATDDAQIDQEKPVLKEKKGQYINYALYSVFSSVFSFEQIST